VRGCGCVHACALYDAWYTIFHIQVGQQKCSSLLMLTFDINIPLGDRKGTPACKKILHQQRFFFGRRAVTWPNLKWSPENRSHTDTHSVSTTIFSTWTRVVGCPLNFPPHLFPNCATFRRAVCVTAASTAQIFLFNFQLVTASIHGRSRSSSVCSHLLLLLLLLLLVIYGVACANFTETLQISEDVSCISMKYFVVSLFEQEALESVFSDTVLLQQRPTGTR